MKSEIAEETNNAQPATAHTASSPTAPCSPWPSCPSADLEPWPTPVDGRLLLDALLEVARRFLVLPKWAAETLALWILHTYAFELRNVTAYLGIESPEKRCGKTTLLTVLGELVNRPVVAANISSPAFFRVIEEMRPTLLIDEADTVLFGNDELRGILNAGYGRKTAFVVRVASQFPAFETRASGRQTGPEDPDSPVPITPPPQHPSPPLAPSSTSLLPQSLLPGSRLAKFSCWCPKAIAAIGRLPETLADRCIVIRMQRKTIHEKCERLRNLDATDLRRQCARFVADSQHLIATAQPQLPEALHDRAADIWEPLLALADLAGGEWPQRARQAATALTTHAQETNPIGSLLWDIFVLFSLQKAERLFSRDLVRWLNGHSDRPWMEMLRYPAAASGRGVTELWLARVLRPYAVRPRSLRIGEDKAKGYLQADFMDVFRRYIPRSEVEASREEDKEC